jgi:hypothetical protein
VGGDEEVFDAIRELPRKLEEEITVMNAKA